MIIGEEKLLKDLDKMSRVDMLAAADEAIRLVQREAKKNCPVNHGELKQSIYTDVEQTDDTVRAVCYTNKSYAPHVEFGTGPVGQAHHEGVSPDSNGSYVQHGWGIPAEKVSPSDAARYGWKKQLYNGKEYYMTSGQAAQPFLYPALHDNQEKISRIFRKGVKK
jgi:HK97 gp10 family phage protein